MILVRILVVHYALYITRIIITFGITMSIIIIIMTMGLLLLFCWLQLSVHQYAVNVFNAFSFQWVQELKVVWARSLQIDGHFFFNGYVLFQRQN